MKNEGNRNKGREGMCEERKRQLYWDPQKNPGYGRRLDFGGKHERIQKLPQLRNYNRL